MIDHNPSNNARNKALAEELRKVISEVRRKPYPLSDLIPLMQRAAAALDT